MKRTDIHKILLIGAGPIVIGQGCEFDYSGVQAVKALTHEGYEVVLVNSNPATVMTDPEMAPHTYIEPITPESIHEIIRRERPDALLPTLGGQTALNVAMEVARQGILRRYKVEMIGANADAIARAEDRELFKEAMLSLGLDMPTSVSCHTLDEAKDAARKIGTWPLIIRPGFTLGGTGGGIAHDAAEFETIVQRGLDASLNSEVLVEESLLGWKEYEMEVMRDRKGNGVIVCSIENLDPMGIHTGDSITVAPIQTLTDREYQAMRDDSLAVLDAIGISTGGSNVQWAVNPETGRRIIIEMNPRVSRSSALASKATGFPIAKIAALLAVGYTLDELRNDITRETPSCFEPALDYVVVKVPRFTFEKFPAADPHLGTQMKSVGEAMAIGRTFKEAFQKALRSLETKHAGFGADEKNEMFFPVPDHAAWDAVRTQEWNDAELADALAHPGADRIFQIHEALRRGWTVERLFELTKIDRWFLRHLDELQKYELFITGYRTLAAFAADRAAFAQAKAMGFSDAQIAYLLKVPETEVRAARLAQDLRPAFGAVDTCAGEFKAITPYFYSTYADSSLRASVSPGEPSQDAAQRKRKIMVLGGGPNRIGQGIEFDYCCVHAAMALREDGYETIMVNCNPETVSTDYDTSDRLYFEPVTLEDVLEICHTENPVGVIVQYGGQTPLKICRALEKEGVPIIGTSTDAIDCAEDRERFKELITKLGLRQPPNRTAHTEEAALKLAEEIGYPIVVRPSYVLGGRAMDIVHNGKELMRYMHEAIVVSEESPVLLDHFLDDAVEMDVDAVSDGKVVKIAGLMQHVEAAGVHSGDSACSLPPYSLREDILDEVRRETVLMAKALGVVGLMNVQFAIKNAVTEHPIVYVLEVNPRASRTVPFVSKATGVQLAKVAARCMVGDSIEKQGVQVEVKPEHICVKEAVFPFAKFLGVDPVLGPEMRSTGEVMGVGKTFGEALFKSQLGAGNTLPPTGSTVFISVRDEDKPRAIVVAAELVDAGYKLVATKGTAEALAKAGIDCKSVNKVSDGRPNILDKIKNREIQLVITTSNESRGEISDARAIRMAALANRVTYFTTIAGGRAAVEGIKHLADAQVYSLQDMHKAVR